MKSAQKYNKQDTKNTSKGLKENLLNNKLFASFIKSKWYPGIFQIPVAVVFAFIMYELLFGSVLAHDNVGTALTWVLWWPMIPIIFLILGRFWCTVCPFGTLSDYIQKFVGHNRSVPQFLKKYGIWIIDATFIMITWSDHIWGIVESPFGSGILMLMITSGVVISGAFFERRTWCRYLCFLGGLSGNYTRAGALELKGTPEKCSKCTVAACYKGSETVDGCPMFEFPKTMHTSANCNLCGNCVKSCPNDSIRMVPRVPTKELWFINKPKFDEAFLSIVIMGIVFVQNITMLEIWKPILNWLENATGTTNYFVTFTITFILVMLIPILMMLLVGFIGSKVNRETVVKNVTRFGYAIIPLDMAGHIAHNLFHLLAEGKSIIYTSLEIIGINVHGQSTAFVSNGTIQILQYILIVLGTIGSIYTAYRISKKNYGSKGLTWKTLAPYAVLMIILGLINIILFSLPMEMRM